VRLEPLQLWFRPLQGPLLPQLQPALAAAAQEQAGPGAHLLRWAITAAEPGRGLRIEAMVLVEPVLGMAAEVRLGQTALGSQGNGLRGCGANGIQGADGKSAGDVSSGLTASGPTPAQAAMAAPGS
jgi:hypothetical protein